MARSVRVRHIDVSLPSVPIGAIDRQSLDRLGTTMKVPGWTETQALKLCPRDKEDETSIWIDPHRKDHRDVWDAGWSKTSGKRLASWPEGFDLDHVFPRSWAIHGRRPVAYVRLLPVWSGVNRSAGAGLEKSLLRRSQTRCVYDQGVYFADELQLHKILGLDPNEVDL